MKLLDIFNNKYKRYAEPVIVWYRGKNGRIMYLENFNIDLRPQSKIYVRKDTDKE